MKPTITSLFIVFLIACNVSPFDQGKVLYESYCSSCHMSDGTGLKNIYPSLKGNERLWNGELIIPCLIKKGHKGNGLSADMPGFSKMKPNEISNIVNYLNHTLNNKPSIGFKMIKSQLDSCRQQN